jgi:hypothetical protein
LGNIGLSRNEWLLVDRLLVDRLLVDRLLGDVGLYEWLLDHDGLLHHLHRLLLDNNGLLDDLLDDWLLDDGLLDYLADANLSFNGVVFNSLLDSLNWDVLCELFILNLGDVFSLILDGVVVGHVSFSRDLNSGADFLVFHN